MEGRIVIPEVAQELEGKFIDSDTFLHFVQDINDDWFLFLSEQDEIDIAQTQYAYLLELPLSPFTPKSTPTIP